MQPQLAADTHEEAHGEMIYLLVFLGLGLALFAEACLDAFIVLPVALAMVIGLGALLGMPMGCKGAFFEVFLCWAWGGAYLCALHPDLPTLRNACPTR